jgi:hypothetical protein
LCHWRNFAIFAHSLSSHIAFALFLKTGIWQLETFHPAANVERKISDGRPFRRRRQSYFEMLLSFLEAID